MQEFLDFIVSYLTEYGLKIIGAVAILVIGLWLAKLITKTFNKTLIKREVDDTLVKFFTAIVRILLIIFVVLAAIDQVGIETTSLVAILGAAGLAVGFALQGSLSNFASGVMLIIFRPIKVGDFIEGGGMSGSVTEIGIFVTILTTPDNKVIYVPNAKLTSDNIVNYSANNTRRVDLTFGIGYSDDIDKAKKVIGYVLYSNSKILTDPAPTVQVNELADSSVNFVVRPWVKSDDYWTVYWELTEAMKKKFDENKIEIPYPQRDVHLHQN
jgi:small conductance mechanosensitive channel